MFQYKLLLCILLVIHTNGVNQKERSSTTDTNTQEAYDRENEVVDKNMYSPENNINTSDEVNEYHETMVKRQAPTKKKKIIKKKKIQPEESNDDTSGPPYPDYGNGDGPPPYIDYGGSEPGLDSGPAPPYPPDDYNYGNGPGPEDTKAEEEAPVSPKKKVIKKIKKKPPPTDGNANANDPPYPDYGGSEPGLDNGPAPPYPPDDYNYGNGPGPEDTKAEEKAPVSPKKKVIKKIKKKPPPTDGNANANDPPYPDYGGSEPELNPPYPPDDYNYGNGPGPEDTKAEEKATVSPKKKVIKKIKKKPPPTDAKDDANGPPYPDYGGSEPGLDSGPAPPYPLDDYSNGPVPEDTNAEEKAQEKTKKKIIKKVKKKPPSTDANDDANSPPYPDYGNDAGSGTDSGPNGPGSDKEEPQGKQKTKIKKITKKIEVTEAVPTLPPSDGEDKTAYFKGKLNEFSYLKNEFNYCLKLQNGSLGQNCIPCVMQKITNFCPPFTLIRRRQNELKLHKH